MLKLNNLYLLRFTTTVCDSFGWMWDQIGAMLACIQVNNDSFSFSEWSGWDHWKWFISENYRSTND